MLITEKFENEDELSHFIIPMLSKKLKEDYQIKDNIDSQFDKIMIEIKHYRFKYEKVLDNKDSKLRKEFLLKPLMQMMKYMHDKFITKQFLKPTLLFINEIDFGYMHLNQIFDYISNKEIDWNIPGSHIYEHYKNTLFAKALRDDPRIKLINIYNHSPKNYIQLIDDIEKNNKVKGRVLFYEGISIDTAFQKFENYVLTEFPRNNLSSHEKVAFFVGIMVGEAKKIKDSIFKFGSIDATCVDMGEYELFFDEYGSKINTKFKDDLIGICDSLLDPQIRRKHGHYNTDDELCYLKNQINEKVVGKNWEKKSDIHYWDSTAGQRKLTRFLKFTNLTSTELFPSNIDIADSRNYNPEGVCKQYDILNDDIEVYIPLSNDPNMTEKYMTEDLGLERKLEKIDPRLISAFKNKTPIFLLDNTPHLSPSDEVDPGAVNNKIRNIMEKTNTSWDKAQSQLFTQIIYRKILMKTKYSHPNIMMGQFLPSVFLKSTSFFEFRKLFFKHFRLVYGVIFKSNEFKDLDSEIPMVYGIWESGEETNKNKLGFHPIERIYDKKREQYEYKINEEKIIYQENLDGQHTFVNWANPKQIKNIGQNIIISGPEKPVAFNGNEYIPPLLGCARYDQEHENYIVSAQIAAGKIITHKNFESFMLYFAKRAFTTRLWYDIHTPFKIPNINTLLYKTACVNSVLAATLTDSISKQSSFTIIKGREGSVKNEFFFMYKNEILERNNIKVDEYFSQSINKKENDRYVASYLKHNKKYLIPEAKVLLNHCRNVTINSLDRRINIGTSSVNKKYLIYYLNWDAGWFHIKSLLYKAEYDRYKKLHKLFMEAFLDILKNI